MGCWGVLPFENDEACDWAMELANVDDLSLVESALHEVEVGAECVGYRATVHALAACETVARLLGRPGQRDVHTDDVDGWVVAHRSLMPSASLLNRARAVIRRILASSEFDACDPEGEAELSEEIADLYRRLGTEERRN